MRVLVLLIAWMCTACQTWEKFVAMQETSDAPAETSEAETKDESQGESKSSGAVEPTADAPVKAAAGKAEGPSKKARNAEKESLAAANDVELRLAKLWARVDEMENQQIQQKERMKLIEKGLLLGIIPDELSKPSKPKPKAKKHVEPEHEDEAHAPATTGAVAAASAPAESPKSSAVPIERSSDTAAYRQLLQTAQEKFNAAQYGQAIVHFNEISAQFDDSVTEGSQHYWIGLSWFYLKEYQLAEQSFKALNDNYASSAWVAHARFYRAKIDQNRGMNQRALTQFQQLIEDFPNQDLAEMARMEVTRMKEKL